MTTALSATLLTSTPSHLLEGRWLAALCARAATRAAATATEDHADVRASLNGDEQAYARLLRRHQGQVAARMWKFTRDRQVLEELVHEVFVQAYYSLHTYRASGPFAAWLARIATRVGYRFWRSRRRPHAVPLENWDGAAPDTQGPDESRQAADQLHELLAQLNPRDRLVLTLMYWENCSVAEAAEQTGWSRTMVKVQAYRARKRLKRLLVRAGFRKGREET